MKAKMFAVTLGLVLAACTSQSGPSVPESKPIKIPRELTLEAKSCWPNGMRCISGAQCCSTHCAKLDAPYYVCTGEPE
jgi:hypothetical protein